MELRWGFRHAICYNGGNLPPGCATCFVLRGPPSGYSTRTPSCVQQQRVGETTPFATTEGTSLRVAPLASTEGTSATQWLTATQWLPKTALLHRNAVAYRNAVAPQDRAASPQRFGLPNSICPPCDGGELNSYVLVKHLGLTQR